MFELYRLRCEYAELHAPSSFGLDELLVRLREKTRQAFKNFFLICMPGKNHVPKNYLKTTVCKQSLLYLSPSSWSVTFQENHSGRVGGTVAYTWI